MNNFKLQKVNLGGMQVEYLVPQGDICDPRSLSHGFTGIDANFRASDLEPCAEHLCRELGAFKLLVVKQCHGTDFVEVDEKLLSSIGDSGFSYEVGEADALLAVSSGWREKVLIGVRTADCVPVLLFSGNCLAVIHAGWRGLAAGILEKVAKRFQELSAGDLVTGIIGPCAGGEVYEVGEEVVAEFKERAKCKALPSGKYLLDLERTAESLLEEAFVENVKIHCTSKCTIRSEDYHSYRRNGAGVGSNLSFLAVAPSAGFSARAER